MNFELTEEHLTVQKAARDFAQTELLPGVIERDTEQGKPIAVSVVTLLVNPAEVERLTLASTEGKIQLALRNPLDAQAPNTAGIRPAGLLGYLPARQVTRVAVAAPRESAPAPAPVPMVEIIRGDKRTQEAVRQE